MTSIRSTPISQNDIENLNSIPILKVAKVLGIEPKANQALCFAGHDSAPSLSFSTAKNLWHCFRCHRGGANIQLVMGVYPQLGFRDAAVWLAKTFGRELSFRSEAVKMPRRPRFRRRRPSSKDEITAQSDPEVYAWVCEQSPLTASGRGYLRSRALGEETIRAFGICEISDAQTLEKAARKKWGEHRLIACGVFAVREFRRRPKPCLVWWDRCLIFPFYNGPNPTYLQARRLVDDGKAKYVGLAGVRKPLFNLTVLNDLRKGDSLYVCQGVIDAMSATELGLPAIAVLGAASYRAQFTPRLLPYNVHVIPDADAAGPKLVAAIRNAFASHGRSVSVVRLGAERDLNEYLCANKRSEVGE